MKVYEVKRFDNRLLSTLTELTGATKNKCSKRIINEQNNNNNNNNNNNKTQKLLSLPYYCLLHHLNDVFNERMQLLKMLWS